jgi:creatinine amidohydrolase
MTSRLVLHVSAPLGFFLIEVTMIVYYRQAIWSDVRRIAEADGLAVLPLGSIEQHGPHMPCGTDTFLINEMVDRSVRRLPPEANVCICPTLEYSVVQWASPMASLGVAPFVLEPVLADLCHALLDTGFSKILLIHGHHGLPCGKSALWQSMQEKRPALYVDFMPYEACMARITELAGEPLGHAGSAETSMMLASHPDKVDMTKAVTGPADLWGADFPYPSLKRPGSYAIPPVESTYRGVEGNSRAATAQIGERIFEALVEAIAPAMLELATRPTPEIYRRMKKVPVD